MWKISNGRIDRLVVFMVRDGVTVPAGALTFEGAGRKRIATFRYAKSWLAAGGHGIDPVHLPPIRRAVASGIAEVPLPFLDAAPDGWGRSILAGAFPEQYFGDGEYLAAAGGERVGELRFGPAPDAPPERWIPSGRQEMTIPGDGDTLEALVLAAEAVEDGAASRQHLELLFRDSGDLGGARPKATIWRDGIPWMAKFQARGDAVDDPRVEAVCLSMARACGIEVPDHEIFDIAGRSVLLVRRFDRRDSGQRIGYTSAATMMGAANTDYATKVTYASLAAKARQHGVAPCEPLLFLRMLFNCFVHNTDDHLRNHGFIRGCGGWRLSPAFDLTVNRSQRLVMAPADGVSPAPDPAAAFASYPAFGMDHAGAVAIYEQLAGGLSVAGQAMDMHGLSRKDRNYLASPWARVFSPSGVSALPVSHLVRSAGALDRDPLARLRELEVAVDLTTHDVRKVGRAIVIRRKDTGQIDNTGGMPARIRGAWTTAPVREYFRGGQPFGPGLSGTVDPDQSPQHTRG
jgi:serine/threonine-protein kinase HipA